MNAKRAAAAGVIATAAMTSLLLVEPSIGLPRIAIGVSLSNVISAVSSHAEIGAFWGWVLDLAVGVIFAMIYASYFEDRLPGGAFMRGVIFGFFVFLLSQIIFAPATGAGFFSSGDIELLIGGLLGHLVFGGVLGYVYGETHMHSPQVAMQA